MQPNSTRVRFSTRPPIEKEMFDDILGKQNSVPCKFCGKTLFVKRRKLDIEYYICPECYHGEKNG